MTDYVLVENHILLGLLLGSARRATQRGGFWAVIERWGEVEGGSACWGGRAAPGGLWGSVALDRAAEVDAAIRV